MSRVNPCVATALSLGLVCAPGPGRANVVACRADGVLLIDGQPTFPIGFTMPPPPDGLTPWGKNGIEELRDAGATFMRTGVMGGGWNDEAIEAEQRWQDAAAKYGLHCWVFLRELGSIAPGEDQQEARLRQVVERFRDHPGMGVWKGEDEPQWGKKPIPPLKRAYDIIKELDPNHPVALTHAPRGTIEELIPYNEAADITGADIYPIGYPPGGHSLEPNNEPSMVGDYTRKMMQVAQGDLPVWMILQICWSGVIQPGKTLRFPTFAEERFMTWQAIINGARGLIYFGGHITKGLSAEDAPLGWNWRFWSRVLRPVIEEVGTRSPAYPAILAPPSPLAVTLSGAEDVEYCVRETDDALWLFACKREGATVEVEFSGLPDWAGAGQVMFEDPRLVQAVDGRFKDWFGPFEVHVYRFGIE